MARKKKNSNTIKVKRQGPAAITSKNPVPPIGDLGPNYKASAPKKYRKRSNAIAGTGRVPATMF